ncbi:MAG: crotonase/enoyl-CoA hydratase family protein [Woeseiaceae bacterium]|nr:crotonase/enoyl-CoA hydratase family protein [Woeseiaceae bacterium]
MAETVSLRVDAHIAHVELNRPSKYNALSFDMFGELAEVGDRIAADTSVRAVVLSGAGDNFCAGIDTSIFGGQVDFRAALEPCAPSPANVFQRAAFVWREVPVPVVCAMHGVAFGAGLQLALGADIRYAAPSATMSILEVKWGLVPDIALSVLARYVSPADKLRELAYTGRVLDADEAQAVGLVTAVADDPLAKARETAAAIAGRSPDAIRAMKRLFNEAWEMSTEDSLRLEAALQIGVMGGENQREAVAANMEKRAPDFKD